MRNSFVLAAALVVGLGFGGSKQAQAQLGSQPPVSSPFPSAHRPGNGPDPLGPDSEANEKIANQQVKLRETERQRRLVEDTNKLLALATELKAAMDKTNKDVLSLEVIHKAEEIERLSKSIKDRMKG